MMRWIDNLLNRITMYRLVEYVLIAELALGIILGFSGTLAISGWSIIISTLELLGVTVITNAIFAKVFGAPRHSDSAVITALILALIIPPHPVDYAFLFWAGVLAIASKYIVAYRAQHVFNPAALAIAITAVTLKLSATWWVGTASLMPLVLIGGLLIIRKLKKFSLWTAFIVPAFLISFVLTLLHHTSLTTALHITVLASPLIFFSTIMLTEPVTMPGTKGWRLAYAMFIGLLFAPQIHLVGIYSTPELALIMGNLVFFLAKPRHRYVMRLRQKQEVGKGVVDFIFSPDRSLSFLPGQYVELTLAHKKPDSRGSRRYFTLATAPTEQTVRFGVKFYPQPSSFKRALFALNPGDTVVASQLGGDFTLPTNPHQKSVFIAGGIGVTPFRSMIKYLLDNNLTIPATLLYSAQTVEEIAYREVFNEAYERLGIRPVYVLTDTTKVPPDWTGQRGFIDRHMIAQEIPDYQHYVFYLSGPNSMVEHFKKVLVEMRVPRKNIKTDFFPGFA